MHDSVYFLFSIVRRSANSSISYSSLHHKGRVFCCHPQSQTGTKEIRHNMYMTGYGFLHLEEDTTFKVTEVPSRKGLTRNF